MLKFYVKVFSSVFVKPLMDLIPVWHGDRYWSKILRGLIPIPLYGPKVKDIFLKFMCKCFVFSMSGFAKSLMDLIPDWHNDRNLSKILHSTRATEILKSKSVRSTDDVIYVIRTWVRQSQIVTKTIHFHPKVYQKLIIFLIQSTPTCCKQAVQV